MLLPRCSLRCLTPSSRGGGCKYVLECLTKWRQQSFDVSINLETHPDKEGAFQKAFQGLLSWTESTTSNFRSSKSKVPQVNSVIRPVRDPEKQETHAKLSSDLVPRDQNRSKSPDISHAPTHDKSQDQIHFG
jgi:hypothetical protein